MGIVLLIIFCALMFSSCSEWENDIYVEDKAETVITDDAGAATADGQLYNMNFDLWSTKGGYDVCYGPGASKEQQSVWGSANSTTASLGKPTCTPDSSFVAVDGSRCAVKLQTRNVGVFGLKKLAAGNIFTGQMGSINLSKMNASLNWGVPFSLRPKTLEGYACYRPAKINIANKPYEDWKGETDSAHVFVLLTDWDGQFTVDPGADKFVDIENDPNIIGYGYVGYRQSMTDYEKFSINIEYRSDRTPVYVVIVASSSALGDYFTGGDGSTLYLDEFRFVY